MPRRFLFAVLLSIPALRAELTLAESKLIDAINANMMEAHVSFLASDLLEGRDTPSRGLELAETYIAAQFRRLGLESPTGDGRFFQNVPYRKVTQPMDGFRLKIERPGTPAWEAAGLRVSVLAAAASHGSDLEVIKVSIANEDSILPAKEAVAGKAVLLYTARLTPAFLARRAALLALEPAIVLTPGIVNTQPNRLQNAAQPKAFPPPLVVTSDASLGTLMADLPQGPTGARLSFNIDAPIEEPITLRNVLAVLPGSDPVLSKQYVLLTAHHDHVGVATRGDGDRINNGANDDASGVATVLALAEAFSVRKERPRRTLVFMTYFGEEKGLLGSRHYASHPVFPLQDTVANINFEHMGRTDDSEGPRIGQITTTGFDYTTIGESLKGAAKDTNVETWRHEKNSDAFFNLSDNRPLAEAGVPAITMLVTYIFPDYHRPGDHWEKLDYANMQRVVRTAALAVSRFADATDPPQWLPSQPRVERYLKANQALHASPGAK
jgi:hypothetical protein